MKTRWRSYVTENFSYKVVSLFIALILWLTILGRRDFTLTKSVDIELLTSGSQTVVSQSVDTVKIKVSGPRTALKKFMESGMSPLVSIDISKKGTGDLDVEVPIRLIEVPFGVKIVSVRPTSVKARVQAR